MKNNCIWVLLNEIGEPLAFETFHDAHFFAVEHGYRCVGKNEDETGREGFIYSKSSETMLYHNIRIVSIRLAKHSEDGEKEQEKQREDA